MNSLIDNAFEFAGTEMVGIAEVEFAIACNIVFYEVLVEIIIEVVGRHPVWMSFEDTNESRSS